MSNNDKTNDLSIFLKDFADGLRELYPYTDDNVANGVFDEENKINPQRFTELLDRKNYETTLIDSNIRAKDAEGNSVSIFGVSGSYSSEVDNPTIDINPENNKIRATVGDLTVEKSLFEIDNNFVADNIHGGVTILGVTGQFYKTLPTCTLTIHNDTAEEVSLLYQSQQGITPADVTMGETLVIDNCVQQTGVQINFNTYSMTKPVIEGAIGGDTYTLHNGLPRFVVCLPVLNTGTVTWTITDSN